jgi:hypothetical protein
MISPDLREKLHSLLDASIDFEHTLKSTGFSKFCIHWGEGVPFDVDIHPSEQKSLLRKMKKSSEK